MSKAPASHFGGMVAVEAQPQGLSKKDDRPKLSRYPKPMRVALIERIEALERMLRFHQQGSTWKEALDEYRESVSSGITNPLYLIKYRDCEGLVNCVTLLDEAFASMHSYKAEDWLTSGVLSAAARFNRRGKTDADTPGAEKMLLEMGVANAPRGNEDTPGTQGWIKKRVRQETGLSERTVNGMASAIKKKSKLQKGIAKN